MVLERGEKLELLVDKTDQLQTQAFQFHKSSKKLHSAMWWKKVCSLSIQQQRLVWCDLFILFQVKCYALIFFCVALVIWILSMIACGGPA